MNYREAVEFLYEQLPMYQRVGKSAFKKDLTNTIELCRFFNDPHKDFPAVHIAGTNGKGSTAHLIASCLQQAGYKTGLYTSPHLREFTERIRVNGIEAEEEWVADFTTRLQPALESIRPSFFEITVVMAFVYFREKDVDIAVIETGLGGRLDSTNVIDPVLSLITNISLDHTDMLGDTIPEIAVEKAGIIKPGKPVIISERQEEVGDVFNRIAGERNSRIIYAEDNYEALPDGGSLVISRNGAKMFDVEWTYPEYQRKNLIGAIASLEVLNENGFNISPQHIQSGVLNLGQTGLKGRWEILGTQPYVIADTGHNIAGITEMLNELSKLQYRRMWIVWGMVDGKDAGAILEMLPKDAHYFFTRPDIPRAMEPEILLRSALNTGLTGEIINDVSTALSTARKNAANDDLILVGGSTFVVAEI